MGGQDKGLIEFQGRPIVERLIKQLREQNIEIVINANRNQQTYQQFGVPVVSDELTDFQGPLAGFASTMKAVDTDYILTLPCDGPVLSSNFVEAFISSVNQSGCSICVAHDGERLQPVYALIKVDLIDELEKFLQSGERKIDRWYANYEYSLVDFSEQKAMFANINKPADHAALVEAEK